MNLDFSREDESFRQEIREWLTTNVPKEKTPPLSPAKRAFDLAWQRKMYDGGWAGINWPKEYGGCGLSTIRQMIWHEEYARAEAPQIGVCFVGINHGGPTLIARASEQQKAFHLPKILKGEVVWCQGFSEPGAGSDLASLRTRAVIDGDELVVTGQKTWTSYAQYADWQELLVRTDPDGRKHAGITWVICNMRTPGISLRPILGMSGEEHWCEVFYNEARIPLSNVVGEINGGWSVAMSTLSFERGTAFMAEQIAIARRVEKLIEIAKETTLPSGRTAYQDDEIARRLALYRAQVTALRAMTYAAVSRNERKGGPGPEGSMIKVYLADLSQALQRLAAEILGPRLLEYGHEEEDELTFEYLRSYASSMGGGTSEIQREIIADRVLGLPRAR